MGSGYSHLHLSLVPFVVKTMLQVGDMPIDQRCVDIAERRHIKNYAKKLSYVKESEIGYQQPEHVNLKDPGQRIHP